MSKHNTKAALPGFMRMPYQPQKMFYSLHYYGLAQDKKYVTIGYMLPTPVSTLSVLHP
jgi:hypothetical protein